MKANWSLPQWQGYVTQGKDLEDRRSRLAEVPICFVEDVKRHLQTVFAVKKYMKDQMKSKKYKR